MLLGRAAQISRTPDTTDKRIVSVTGYDEQGLPYTVAPAVPNQVTSGGLFSNRDCCTEGCI